MLRRLLFSLCLLSVCGWAKTPRPLAEVPISTVSGPKINLRQYHAKVVLMVVFSTHCQDCLKTLQLMNKLQKDYGKFGFQAVAAAGDDDAKSTLQEFTERYRPEFPVGYLSQQEIIKLCDVPTGKRPFVPISLFIDHNGQVRYQFYGNEGFYQREEQGMRGIIQGLLKESGAKVGGK